MIFPDWGTAPVSYTHLDVYKRQVELCVPLAQPEKPAMEPPGRMATLNLDI